MWAFLDVILLRVWLFFEQLVITVFSLIIYFLNFFVLIIDLFFKKHNSSTVFIRSDSKFFNKNDTFFIFFFDLLKSFSTYIKRKNKIRRYVFLMLLIIIIFLYSPPSHWGPWYKYQTGVASYYSTGFFFKRTANGEIFMPFSYTAAHRTLPLGTTIKVENPLNGRVVYVRITDKGPFKKGRIMDLSKRAAEKLGLIMNGTGKVRIYTRRHFKH